MEKISWSRRGKPRFFYGWAVVLAAFLIMLNGAGRLTSFGLFFKDLQAEFGWSATVISSFQSLNSVVRMVATFAIGGWAVDRYGPRAVIITTTVVGNICMCLLSQAHTLAQFYLLYAFSGIIGPLLAVAQSTPQKWFRERTGLVLGIVAAGGGVGGFVYLPLIGWIISVYGWRTGFLALGILHSVINILVAALIVPSPEKMGLQPYGAEKAARRESTGRAAGGKPANAGVPAWSWQEAVRTRAFILLCLSLLFVTLPGAMVALHFFPFAAELGISKTVAATVYSAMGIIGIPSRIILSGLTPGILGWRQGLILWSALGAATTLWLVTAASLWMLWAYVILQGMFSSVRGVLQPGIIGDYYGMKSLTPLISFTTVLTWAGNALGPIVGGLLYDLTGSYFIPFLAAFISFAIGAALLIPLQRPKKETARPSAI